MRCKKSWLIAMAVFLIFALASTLIYLHSFHGQQRVVLTRAFQFGQPKCSFHDNELSVGQTAIEGCQFCVCKAADRLQCRDIPHCTSNGDKVQVVTTATKRTIGGTVALINSIQSNTNSTVVYYVVVDDSHTHIHLSNWLEHTQLQSLPVTIIDLPHGLVPGSAKHPVNYARHYIPRLLPQVVGRVLYINPNSVVQGNILDLWKSPIQTGHWVAASSNCRSMGKHVNVMEVRFSNYMNFANPIIREANLVPSQCTFDDGVFILELFTWRHNNVSSQLRIWTEMDAKSKIFTNMGPGEEQLPPFLVVLRNKHTELDPLWNVRSLGSPQGRRYSMAFLKTAQLLQWSGSIRPWERKAEHSNLWDKYFIPDPANKFRVRRRRSNHE